MSTTATMDRRSPEHTAEMRPAAGDQAILATNERGLEMLRVLNSLFDTWDNRQATPVEE